MARRIQLILLAFVVIAGIRVALIYRGRHEAAQPKQVEQPAALDADAYVVPRKLRAYDLKSARQLIGKAVWVKAGYGVAFYGFDKANKKANFTQQAGLLAPIEKLEITDVVTNQTPVSAGEWQGPANARFRVRTSQQQVLAVFQSKGQAFGFPIGTVKDGDYKFFIDEALFIEDPHELYKHWPAEVWQAIEQHQVKPGMNELQASFAVGVNDSASNDSGETVEHYANNGHPLSVTYDGHGKAVKIVPEQEAAQKH